MLSGVALVHYQTGAFEQGRDIATKAVELNADVHTLGALIINQVALGRPRRRVLPQNIYCKCSPTIVTPTPIGSFH